MFRGQRDGDIPAELFEEGHEVVERCADVGMRWAQRLHMQRDKRGGRGERRGWVGREGVKRQRGVEGREGADSGKGERGRVGLGGERLAGASQPALATATTCVLVGQTLGCWWLRCRHPVLLMACIRKWRQGHVHRHTQETKAGKVEVGREGGG